MEVEMPGFQLLFGGQKSMAGSATLAYPPAQCAHTQDAHPPFVIRNLVPFFKEMPLEINEEMRHSFNYIHENMYKSACYLVAATKPKRTLSVQKKYERRT